ncbi:hypothetical protein SNL152K_10611 [Streptomyces sp. NL15-2K]|nr:hypothetical protein SNL152K_10611 [Streptomyces sp. NL15-2K]
MTSRPELGGTSSSNDRRQTPSPPHVGEAELLRARYGDDGAARRLREEEREGVEPVRYDQTRALAAEQGGFHDRLDQTAVPDADELLYARVDLVDGEDGEPRVMELELVEPNLFLFLHPGSVPAVVEAVLAAATR